jgi:hypothetical protein
MMGMTMTDTRTYAFRYRCRRGDVIAWAERHTYTYANSTVRSVTRDGIVKTADTGFGAPSEVHHDIASAAVRCEQVDLDRARAWLASDANWPRRGSVPLRSMDEVRAVVRSWLRED